MITITPQKPSDVEEVLKILEQVWIQTYPNELAGITTQDIKKFFEVRNTPEYVQKNKEGVSNPPNNKKYWVAKENERIVGMCNVVIHENVNQLKSIHVLPEYQRQGIGHMFWEKALAFFDPNKDIIVQVATYNQKAINFYKKLGFVDTGKRFTEERHRMPVSGTLIPEMEMMLKRR